MGRNFIIANRNINIGNLNEEFDETVIYFDKKEDKKLTKEELKEIFASVDVIKSEVSHYIVIGSIKQVESIVKNINASSRYIHKFVCESYNDLDAMKDALMSVIENLEDEEDVLREKEISRRSLKTFTRTSSSRKRNDDCIKELKDDILEDLEEIYYCDLDDDEKLAYIVTLLKTNFGCSKYSMDDFDDTLYNIEHLDSKKTSTDLIEFYMDLDKYRDLEFKISFDKIYELFLKVTNFNSNGLSDLNNTGRIQLRYEKMSELLEYLESLFRNDDNLLFGDVRRCEAEIAIFEHNIKKMFKIKADVIASENIDESEKINNDRIQRNREWAEIFILKLNNFYKEFGIEPEIQLIDLASYILKGMSIKDIPILKETESNFNFVYLLSIDSDSMKVTKNIYNDDSSMEIEKLVFDTPKQFGEFIDSLSMKKDKSSDNNIDLFSDKNDIIVKNENIPLYHISKFVEAIITFYKNFNDVQIKTLSDYKNLIDLIIGKNSFSLIDNTIDLSNKTVVNYKLIAVYNFNDKYNPLFFIHKISELYSISSKEIIVGKYTKFEASLEYLKGLNEESIKKLIEDQLKNK